MYKLEFLPIAKKDMDDIIYYVSNNLKNMITNHKCLLNPLYDNQIIEIMHAFQVLISIGEKEFVSQWLIESMNHIVFAYNSLGKYFPTCTNDFYD